MSYISILMDPWNLSIIIFIAVMAAVLWKDRKNIEREGVIFLRRTQRGIDFIDSIAKKSPRFWKILSSIGVIVCFGAMVFGFYFLLRNLINVIFVPGARAAAAVVLPTPSTQPTMGTGYFLVPFWYWIIGITSVVVVHELMHGIIGRAQDFPIKSVGWAVFFGIIPGAFVEPEGEKMLPEEETEDDTKEESDDSNEEEEEDEEGKPWKQGNWIERLRVLAAGSFSNFLLAAVLLLALFGTTTSAYGGLEVKGMYQHNGVEVLNIADNSPASQIGLRENMTIRKINNVNIRSVSDFSKATNNITLEDSVEIIAENTSFKVVPVEKPPVNYSYSPAPIDYILVNLEKIFPGTINSYENSNDLLVPEDKVIRLSRWKWVKKNYPGLEKRAEENIEALKKNKEKEPWVGITVVNDKEIRKGWLPFKTPLTIILRVVLFMVLVNFGIGLVNILPIKPLDGGLMIEAVSEKFKPGKAGLITKSLTYLTVGILLSEFVILYLTYFILP